MTDLSSTSCQDQMGAVILCGGRSRRMGFDKANLPLGESTFLEEVVKRIEPVVGKIVLVGNRQQNLESFQFDSSRSGIEVAFDEQNGFGPLEGIRVGLKCLASRFRYAFLTSCDVPLLCTDLIPFLFSRIGKHEAVIPFEAKHNRIFGMTAVYQTSLHKPIAELIENDELRVSGLAKHFDTKLIDIDELKTIDPTLQSFFNINQLADYRKLLKRQSLQVPERFREPQ